MSRTEKYLSKKIDDHNTFIYQRIPLFPQLKIYKIYIKSYDTFCDQIVNTPSK